jgi:hypothetical protein
MVKTAGSRLSLSPSITARAAGAARTTMGRAAVPRKRLVKEPR